MWGRLIERGVVVIPPYCGATSCFLSLLENTAVTPYCLVRYLTIVLWLILPKHNDNSHDIKKQKCRVMCGHHGMCPARLAISWISLQYRLCPSVAMERECHCGSYFAGIIYMHILKGKAVPLQAWSGPEGSRKLRFLDFMTTAQDGGKVVSLTHRPPLPPGNTPGTHFC